MDDHFNEALKILTNHPNDLDISSANDMGFLLLSSTDQDMIINMISRGRSIEDRVLIFTCLASMRSKHSDEKDFEVLASHCLETIKQKDTELRDIDNVSPEEADKISSGLMELITEADLGDNPSLNNSKINDVVGRAVKKSSYLFSPKSLYSITFAMLNLMGKKDDKTVRLYALFIDAVLRGRRMLYK